MQIYTYIYVQIPKINSQTIDSITSFTLWNCTYMLFTKYKHLISLAYNVLFVFFPQKEKYTFLPNRRKVTWRFRPYFFYGSVDSMFTRFKQSLITSYLSKQRHPNREHVWLYNCLYSRTWESFLLYMHMPIIRKYF